MMSLFDLIRYPVTKDTTDFTHIPDDIWDKYLQERMLWSTKEINAERETNAKLIQIIREWNEYL
jgi:hypothetical protein